MQTMKMFVLLNLVVPTSVEATLIFTQQICPQRQRPNTRTWYMTYLNRLLCTGCRVNDVHERAAVRAACARVAPLATPCIEFRTAKPCTCYDPPPSNQAVTGAVVLQSSFTIATFALSSSSNFLRGSIPGHQLVVRCMLRGPQQATQGVLCGACQARKHPTGPPEGPPGGPPEASFFAIYGLIYARKPTIKMRLNASRTSKRRVLRLGMSWRRNELITLTLPKSQE